MGPGNENHQIRLKNGKLSCVVHYIMYSNVFLSVVEAQHYWWNSVAVRCIAVQGWTTDVFKLNGITAGG